MSDLPSLVVWLASCGATSRTRQGRHGVSYLAPVYQQHIASLQASAGLDMQGAAPAKGMIIGVVVLRRPASVLHGALSQLRP